MFQILAANLCSSSRLQYTPGETRAGQGGEFGILPPCPIPALEGVRQDFGSCWDRTSCPQECAQLQTPDKRQLLLVCVCLCVERVYKSVPRPGNLLRLLDLREVAFLLYSQITQL